LVVFNETTQQLEPMELETNLTPEDLKPFRKAAWESGARFKRAMEEIIKNEQTQ